MFIGQELPHGVVGVQFYQITVWSNTVYLTEAALQMRVLVAVPAFNVHVNVIVTTSVLSLLIVTRVPCFACCCTQMQTY